MTAVLAVGVVARLTRLASRDTITTPLRVRLPDRLYRLVACGWCVSIWIAFPVAASWWAWGHCAWWHIAALALTASWFAGALQNASEPVQHDVALTTQPPQHDDETVGGD